MELFGGCAKSLEYIQCRVAAINIFRVEVALYKLTGLFFDPSLYFVSAKEMTQTVHKKYTKKKKSEV